MSHVLLVEDDVFISKSYRLILEESGLTVTTARDGKLALQALTAQKPDLIVLDLILPEIDGFQLLKEIKSNPSLKNIPVIVMSNLGQQEDQETVMALGATAYLIKSDIDLGNFAKKITDILESITT